MSQDTSKTAAGNAAAAGTAGINDKQDRNAESEPQTEIGGRGGLDPTRYGDWEKDGRCIDF